MHTKINIFLKCCAGHVTSESRQQPSDAVASLYISFSLCLQEGQNHTVLAEFIFDFVKGRKGINVLLHVPQQYIISQSLV